MTEKSRVPDGHVDEEGNDDNDSAEGSGRGLTRIGRIGHLTEADSRRNAKQIIPNLDVGNTACYWNSLLGIYLAIA